MTYIVYAGFALLCVGAVFNRLPSIIIGAGLIAVGVSLPALFTH